MKENIIKLLQIISIIAVFFLASSIYIRHFGEFETSGLIKLNNNIRFYASIDKETPKDNDYKNIKEIKPTKSKLIFLKTVLQNNKIQNPYIFFESVDENFEILLDNKLIYKTYEKSLFESSHKGFELHSVKLPKELNNKELLIKAYSKFGFKQIYWKKIFNIYLGNPFQMEAFNVKESLGTVVFAFVLVLSAISLSLFYIKIVGTIRLSVTLGFSFILVMIGAISGFAPIKYIFINNSLFWYYIPIICQIGLIFMMLYFIKHYSINKINKNYAYLYLIILFLSILFLLLDILGIKSIYDFDTAAIYLIYYITTIFLSINFHKKWDARFRVLLTIIIICLLTFFYDRFYLYLSQNDISFKPFIIYGVLIVITCNIIFELLEIDDLHLLLTNTKNNLKQKNKKLSKLNLELKFTNVALADMNKVLEDKVEKRSLELNEANYTLIDINNKSTDANQHIEEMNKQLSKLNDQLTSSHYEKDEINSKIKDALIDVKKKQVQLIEMEKLNALGALVAGFAHEVNTPIGVSITSSTYVREIIGNTLKALLEEKLKKSVLDKYFEQLSITNNILSENLETAINLISSFKKFSADQVSEIRKTFNLKEYIEIIIASMTPEIKKLNAKVEFECSESIIMDSFPGVISQILSHLIVNSLKHAFSNKTNGVLTIKACEIEKQIILEYHDNGKGIEENVLKNIFVPFYSTLQSRDSRGLGLYFVYDLITNKLGGSIECKSTIKKGTSFYMKFARDI